MSDFKEKLELYRSAAEEYLSACFSEDTLPAQTLSNAMRYSLLAGGKRIRPILTLEFCHICGGDWHNALPFAAAIEMVHTYSLIHDDLPCMDNDDYRRGRLTNHKVFGDAVATLAGDGLLTEAFRVVASAPLEPHKIARAVEVLSASAGASGMVGGQVLDIEGENQSLGSEEVNLIHRLKTGCMISAACKLGVIAAGGSEEQLSAAEAYAESLGLAFQIRDDMLDVLGDAKKLGKATNMDANKTTFVTLYGVDECAKRIAAETERAISALSVFSEKEFLAALAERMAVRDS